MKYLILISAVLLSLLLLTSCVTPLKDNVSDMLVRNVDIERYSGLWYQVGMYPHWFQTGDCSESTAEYNIRPDGRIDVLNRCWKDNYEGEYGSQVSAVAEPVNDDSSRLKVLFYGIFPADYLIIELDSIDYQWAAVTTPSLDTLWILSRKPELPAGRYDSIVESLVRKGFDRDRILKTSRQN